MCLGRGTFGDLLVSKSRDADRIAAKLAGQNASPLEHLLIERVALTWLQVQEADLRYAQFRDVSWREAGFQQHRMSAANKRFAAAVRTFAAVRRLALPVLVGLVKVAARQANVTRVESPTAIAD